MTKRKDGRWQESLTINGKRHLFYGRTKADVLRKIKGFEFKREHGISFSELAEEWWEYHEPKLSYNTTKGYKPAKVRAINTLGDKSVKDIIPTQINQHIKEFSLTHAEKTVKTQLLVYNLIFKYAVEMGYCLFNPVRDLSIPDNLPKTKRTSPPQHEIEIVKSSVNLKFGLFMYMALYTGLRCGELLALTWDDINLKERTITIKNSLYHINNKPYLKPPKTKKSEGQVPILNKLYDVLKPSKGIVFANEHGEYLTDRQFRTLLKNYKKETGITSTPHQFRHAYATMLFEAGIPPEEAQVLLRHAQISTTMDIYTDLREEKKRKIFENAYDIDMV